MEAFARGSYRLAIFLNRCFPNRVSRELATPFTAWSRCQILIEGRFNVLLVSDLVVRFCKFERTSKRPDRIFAIRYHVLKDMAICPAVYCMLIFFSISTLALHVHYTQLRRRRLIVLLDLRAAAGSNVAVAFVGGDDDAVRGDLAVCYFE